MSAGPDSVIPPLSASTGVPAAAAVDHEHAWRLAAEAIARAQRAQGSLLLFEGPRGIGKSALLATIRSLAATSGTEVLSATGRRRERELQQGVLLQLFESGLEAQRPDGWLPDLTAAGGSLKTFHALYRLIHETSRDLPLTLVVDDVELADETSLGFLLYLAERMEALPVALILGSGPVPAGRKPALLRDIERHPLTVRRRIAPLTREATAQRLAYRRFGADTGEADEIHDASGGNPFLVDALAAELAGLEGRVPRPSVHELAPAGVAEWALAQAEEVHAHAPALVRAVATLGQGCELRNAAELAGLDLEDALGVVDAMCEVGLFVGMDSLSFAYPVVGASVAAAMAPGARALTNLHAARLLVGEHEPAERAARHLLLAPRTGSGRVVDALSRASSEALDRGAPAAAVRYLRRALAEPPAAGRRVQVVLDLGGAEALAGEPQAALRLRDAADHLADALEDPSAALTTGRTLFALGRAEEALVVFARGLASADSADPDIAGALRAAHATALWLTKLPSGTERRLAPPPTALHTVGDRTFLAIHAIEAAIRNKPRAQVEALAERALQGGFLLEEETADGLPYYLATGALVYSERLERAEGALTGAVEDARRRGSVFGLATASHVRAAVILKQGRLVDAALEAGRALAVAPHGWRFGLGGARVVLATTLLERGDLAAARQHLDAAESAPDKSEPFRLALLRARGRLHLFAGAPDKALADFLACGALADQAGATNPAVAPWRSGAGLALAIQGDLAEARRLIETELALAKGFGAPGPIGSALRRLAATYEPDRARDALEAAVEALGSSEAVLDRATALVDFGSALRRSGRRRAAKEPLKEGLALADDCCASTLAARASRELKLAGARPRRTALSGRKSLTDRELEVATMAAAGLSNRKIAETLVVTMKTVEWHLHHAYRKLGVRSRGELGDSLSRSVQDGG
jgi:ATP/maltotriose-dependent transcriptional regulator MalT